VKILILEDDAKVARFVRQALTEDGYTVDLCTTGKEAIDHAMSGIYNLIILDWMVPDVDGVAACREIRRSGIAAPILMLTARGEIKERVLGLDAGADDYLTKPFELDELLARVRALVRRTAGIARLKCGDLEIDRIIRRVTLLGKPLTLTSREYALLVRLANRADQTVTRTDLIAHVWETSFDPGSNLVEVHVSRLREKLGAHRWMIETVRGTGYRLRTRPDAP